MKGRDVGERRRKEERGRGRGQRRGRSWLKVPSDASGVVWAPGSAPRASGSAPDGEEREEEGVGEEADAEKGCAMSGRSVSAVLIKDHLSSRERLLTSLTALAQNK